MGCVIWALLDGSPTNSKQQGNDCGYGTVDVKQHFYLTVCEGMSTSPFTTKYVTITNVIYGAE